MISAYKYQGVTWVDLESPTEDELLHVISEYNVPENLLNELVTETLLSKVESYKDTDHHSASLLGNTARNISPELEKNIRPEKQAMDTRKSSRFGT